MSSPRVSQVEADRTLSARPRFDSVDMMRGLVMVLMALDHTRDFVGDVAIDPMDMSRTHPALFWTRWITHFCAPTFVFLAGASAYLIGRRGRTPAELSRFLLTRGLWIVLLEFTFVRFGWTFSLDYHWIWAQVIWAIGWSLVLISFLVRMPPRVVGCTGVAIIALHNLTDGIGRAETGAFYPLWSILHRVDILKPAEGWFFLPGYPLLNWFGVALAGYGFGTVLLRDVPDRRRFMIRTGALMLIGFVALRATNLYGDPQKWSVQPDAVFTLFSFLNTTKYGPSLLYVLMTLGPMLLVLGFLQGRELPQRLKFLVTFGRVPMFYYLMHVPVIHVMAMAIALVTVGHAGFLVGIPHFLPGGGPMPQGWGLPLPWVYVVWIAAVALLYPMCAAFARLKQRSRSAWLSYF